MQVKTRFSKKEHSDSGVALLLITLISAKWLNLPVMLTVAIAEVLVLLLIPVLLYPFTFLWLNISDFLGKIVSKIILAAVFIIIVCPVALIRKSIGKDTLKLNRFKKDTFSVFTDRNHTFSKTDFTTPY